jgi:enolase-phosphatase E1
MSANTSTNTSNKNTAATIKTVVLDIEGTTTDIKFVHQVLFPFARKHLRSYLQSHQKTPEIAAVISDVKKELNDDASLTQVIDLLTQWIDEDKKTTPLKTLQGLIWQQGYLSGELKSHLYDDVLPAMQQWHEQGIGLAIYSSGSVGAQKLLFGYTESGDLTPLLSHYFDTNVGHKQTMQAYINITKQLAQAPDELVFLSDVVGELDAAKAAGLRTIQLHRDGQPTGQHSIVNSFAQISLSAPNLSTLNLSAPNLLTTGEHS